MKKVLKPCCLGVSAGADAKLKGKVLMKLFREERILEIIQEREKILTDV